VAAASADRTITVGHEGVKEMLVVPISFYEHIETLHEINIEARTEAAKLASIL